MIVTKDKLLFSLYITYKLSSYKELFKKSSFPCFFVVIVMFLSTFDQFNNSLLLMIFTCGVTFISCFITQLLFSTLYAMFNFNRKLNSKRLISDINLNEYQKLYGIYIEKNSIFHYLSLCLPSFDPNLNIIIFNENNIINYEGKLNAIQIKK